MQNDTCVADFADNVQGLVVAFASSDGEMIDQHFGSALGFYIYEVTAESAVLITEKQFNAEKKDGNEDKLKPKLAYLVGSDIVYCSSVGNSATRQLLSLGITPMAKKGGPDIEELIDDLQQQLTTSPAFWLANIMRQKSRTEDDAKRFTEEDVSWD